MPLSSFTLNMNMVFERFLGRYLHSPEDVRMSIQDVRFDVFSYLENAGGWNQPTIRPDFVFHRRKQVVAVADAKYKNRLDNPPSFGRAVPAHDPRAWRTRCPSRARCCSFVRSRAASSSGPRRCSSLPRQRRSRFASGSWACPSTTCSTARSSGGGRSSVSRTATVAPSDRLGRRPDRSAVMARADLLKRLFSAATC